MSDPTMDRSYALRDQIVLQLSTKLGGLGYRTKIKDPSTRVRYSAPDLSVQAAEPQHSSIALKLSVWAGAPEPWPLELQASSYPSGPEPYAPRKSTATYKGKADKLEAFVASVVGKLDAKLKDLIEKEKLAHQKYGEDTALTAERRVWTEKVLRDRGFAEDDLFAVGIFVRRHEGTVEFRHRGGHITLSVDSPELFELVTLAASLNALRLRVEAAKSKA